MQEETRIDRIERFSFAVRLESLFFPLEYGAVTDILKEQRGFNIEPSPRLPELPPGARLEVGGKIASRDDLKFRMHPERGVVGVDGKKIDDVLDEFQEVAHLFKEKLDVDLDDRARFYEFTCELFVVSSKETKKTLAELFSGFEHMKRFREIIGHDTVNYGIRLVPARTDPDSAHWFDYKIEPMVTNPNRTYYVYVVYRDKKDKKNAVMEAAKRLEETTKSLVKAMEGA